VFDPAMREIVKVAKIFRVRIYPRASSFRYFADYGYQP